MRRSLLLSLLLFLCAVPFVRAAMPGPGMPVPAPVVEVGEVLAVQDTQSRRYTGRVVSPATVSLVPRVAGEILEVGFRDGDTVQAGQMLYRIDPVRYEAAVKNARGKVVQYKAEHAYARADLARNRSLFKKQAVSRDVLESAERTEQVAYGELLAAEADLVTAQDDLRNTRIVAPMAGRIGVTAFTAGNYVTTSSGTLVTLVRTDPVRVRFGLSVRDMQAVFGSEEELRSLGRVRVRLADGTDYGTEGRVRDGLPLFVLVGIDLDEKRLHVAVALALAQRLIDVAGTGGAAGVHGGVHAAQLVYAGNDGIAGELVIQEGAQTDAQRAGHLLQGADGGIYLVIFHAFQKIDGQSRIL